MQDLASLEQCISTAPWSQHPSTSLTFVFLTESACIRAREKEREKHRSIIKRVLPYHNPLSPVLQLLKISSAHSHPVRFQADPNLGLAMWLPVLQSSDTKTVSLRLGLSIFFFFIHDGVCEGHGRERIPNGAWPLCNTTSTSSLSHQNPGQIVLVCCCQGQDLNPSRPCGI